MSGHLVVIGGGFAGVAAAFEARRAGARVTLVTGGAGASSLYAGAADEVPWDEVERASRVVGAPLVAHALSEGLARVLAALDLFDVPAPGAPLPLLVTTAGTVRTTRARERALLDLSRVRGRTLLVPRADRAGWDADSIVRCLREALPDVDSEAISTPVLRFDEEKDIVDAELAARHDEAGRLSWLAERLSAEVERRGRDRAAVLLGPWLGIAAPRAAELEARVGVPIGEALAATAGTAGFRFESRRDALLAAVEVTIASGFVTQVERDGVVVTDRGDRIPSDAIVLAAGGLLGGGLVYDPPEHGAAAEGPTRSAPSMKLGFEMGSIRVTSGGDAGIVSSSLGPDLDEVAWPSAGAEGWLERAGVLSDEAGLAKPRTWVAGDMRAPGRSAFARRTVLVSLGSGVAAGAAAAKLLGAPAPDEKRRLAAT